MDKNITFIIQGPLNKYSINNIDNYLEYGNIIISHWKNDDLNLLKNVNKNIKIVTNKNVKIDNVFNKYNIYLQCLTTLSGLRNVNTEYSIKVRSDEYRTDFSMFVDKIFKNPNKIITDNVFFRSKKYAKYCISDHCFGGKTEILLKSFENIKKKCEDGTYFKENYFLEEILRPTKYWCGDKVYSPEQIISTEIIQSFGDDIDPKNSKEQMMKYFDLIRIKDMGKFIISQNHIKTNYITEESMGIIDILILTNINKL